jgi:hypothetical protein
MPHFTTFSFTPFSTTAYHKQVTPSIASLSTKYKPSQHHNRPKGKAQSTQTMLDRFLYSDLSPSLTYSFKSLH